MAALSLLALVGCSSNPAPEQPNVSSADPCAVPKGTDLAPPSGILSGINLDLEKETVKQYASRLGRRPAVVVSSAPLPFTAEDKASMDGVANQLRTNGGILLLTLEPDRGLDSVTDDAANSLAALLDGYNKAGVPVIVRFAPEMNGSWSVWGQNPGPYRAAFRSVAEAVHRDAPGSAMMWAPSYGGGYPFEGGVFSAAKGTANFTALDTTQDGKLTEADDPYGPYYPGDDAVDWVGIAIQHWGTTYPSGANVAPEPNKFVEELRGTFDGADGSEVPLPDFYAEYGDNHGKPVAITETSALVTQGADPAVELDIKRRWWRQLFDPRIQEGYPKLKMINWFEWNQQEPEAKAVVDWRVTASEPVRKAYIADLPAWFRFASPPACPTRPGIP